MTILRLLYPVLIKPDASTVLVGSLCCLPASMDVGLQTVSRYRSNYWRRFTTGLLLGMGVVVVARVLKSLVGL
jgi:uncharacterized membrane protein